MQRPEAVVFDVIGTLFSLDPLRGVLETAGIPGDALEVLFAETLRDAFALAATGVFQPLQAVLDANLDALLHRYGVKPGAVPRKAALTAMQELPAYPDAAEALTVLSNANIPTLGTEQRQRGCDRGAPVPCRAARGDQAGRLRGRGKIGDAEVRGLPASRQSRWD